MKLQGNRFPQLKLYGLILAGIVLVGLLFGLWYLKNRRDRQVENVSVNGTVTSSADPSMTPSPSPSPTSSANGTPASPSPNISTSASPSTTATPSPNPAAANHKELALAAYQNKQYETAASEYQLAIKEENNPAVLADLWNLLGNSNREMAKNDLAIQAYDTSLGYNSLNGDVYLNKAALLWSMGQKNEAKAVLQVGIDKNASRLNDLQNLLSVYQVRSQ